MDEEEEDEFDIDLLYPGVILMQKYIKDYKGVTQELEMIIEKTRIWIKKNREHIQELTDLNNCSLKEEINGLNAITIEAENILQLLISKTTAFNEKLQYIDNRFQHISVFASNFPFATVCQSYEELTPFSTNLMDLARHLISFVRQQQ